MAGTGDFQRLIAWLGDAPAEQTERHFCGERSDADRDPVVLREEALDGDFGAGGLAGERHIRGGIGPQLLQVGVVGQNRQGLARATIRRVEVAGPQIPLDLRNRDGPRPVGSRRPLPHPSGGADDANRNQHRAGDRDPAPCAAATRGRVRAARGARNAMRSVASARADCVSTRRARARARARRCARGQAGVGPKAADVRRVRIHRRVHRRPGGVALERTVSGEQLEHHHAQREDVAACVSRPSFDLFRRHVADRAGGAMTTWRIRR